MLKTVMEITSEQLINDRDRVFADWGETVTLKQVAQTFDPNVQQISETETELTVTAIVGVQPTGDVADAGGQLQSVDLTLQIRSEDWTANAGDVTWRTLVRGRTYDVVNQTESGDSQVIELHCRKVAGP